MRKVFVSNDEFPRVIERSGASGHKKIVIADDVKPSDAIVMRTDGDILRIEKDTSDSDEEPVYCILCKEFGLFGYNKKFISRISYILCDDGWMLVTLIKGAFTVNLNEKLLLPSVGVEDLPNLVEKEILWVDKEYLYRYCQYMKEQGYFPYDFEFVAEVSGGIVSGLSSFKFLHIGEEDVDLSLGKFAQFLQEQQNKEDARNARKLQQQFTQTNTADTQWDDDEEEEEDQWDEEEEEEDEYDNF